MELFIWVCFSGYSTYISEQTVQSYFFKKRRPLSSVAEHTYVHFVIMHRRGDRDSFGQPFIEVIEGAKHVFLTGCTIKNVSCKMQSFHPAVLEVAQSDLESKKVQAFTTVGINITFSTSRDLGSIFYKIILPIGGRVFQKKNLRGFYF